MHLKWFFFVPLVAIILYNKYDHADMSLTKRFHFLQIYMPISGTNKSYGSSVFNSLRKSTWLFTMILLTYIPSTFVLIAFVLSAVKWAVMAESSCGAFVHTLVGRCLFVFLGKTPA